MTSLTASKLSHRTSYLAMPIKPNSDSDQVFCSSQYLSYNVIHSQTHEIFSKAQVTNGAHSNEARPASSWYHRRPPTFFGGSHLASFRIVQVMLVPAISFQKKRPQECFQLPTYANNVSNNCQLSNWLVNHHTFKRLHELRSSIVAGLEKASVGHFETVRRLYHTIYIYISMRNNCT